MGPLAGAIRARTQSAARSVAEDEAVEAATVQAVSQPRFLADHDLNEQILDGLLRREPAVEVVRAREVRIQDRSDDEVLQYAANKGFLVISHD